MMKSLSLALLAGALSGARAEIQLVKGGDMCAGYNSDSDDFKIYYGPCESADTVTTDAETTPYFTAETQDMALIKDGDSAYLTDDSKVEPIDATGTFSDAQADQDGGDGSTYAYVIGQATAGDSTASGTFGTAFYLVQSGSISSAYNKFPAAADGSGEVNVCISEITNGVCGAERTWNAGDLKYTLYGHIEGTDVGAAVADYDYLGVRQHVTLQRSDPDTVTATFNDGIALEDMGGTDVTGFTLTFAGGKTASHTFPSKYNVGSTADCTEDEGSTEADPILTCATTPENSFTRDIKIKVSAADDGVYFDYLFALAPSASGVNDGLNTADRYFVYDPDVSTGVVADTSDKTSGVATAVGSVALGALAAAVFFQG